MDEQTPKPAEITPAVSYELTPQNRLFIFYLNHGEPEAGKRLTVFESYQMAGYKGDKHAAYQLKSRLEKELLAEALNTGMSRADIVRNIASLVELPVVGDDGKPVSSLTVQQHTRLLALGLKAHEATQALVPKITAIQINRYDKGEKKAVDSVIIETTAERQPPSVEEGE